MNQLNISTDEVSKPKLLIFIVAYHAASTIASVLSRIPFSLYIATILKSSLLMMHPRIKLLRLA
jgi:hypothetical protein